MSFLHFAKNFFICLFILEKKNLSLKIQYFSFIINEINIIKYFYYKFFDKNLNPIKSKKFKEYLRKNKKFWKNENFQNDNKILVENFINHPGYTLSNAICANYLGKIYKKNIIALIREGDLKAEFIFKSFSINEIYKIKSPNFLFRLRSLYKAIKMLSNVKDINHFCKLKLNNIEIGLSTYDTFIRYTKIPTLNKVSFELIVLFSHAISSYFFIRNFLETEGKNIKISVQSETVFNPLNIFFQICLQKKIDVFARCGENEISLRRYTNWSQRHDYRYNISNKFFKFIEKKISKDKYNKIYLIYQKKKKNLKYGFDTKIPLVNYSNLKLINRDQILKSFNWHKNKKIIVFFMNVLIDRNFHNGPRLNFKDNYSWTKYILDKMRKINNVNWIIKKHPIQNLYNSTYNFENEIKEICQNNKHIKVYPEKFSNSCLLDIADKIITSHGTAGIEYPAHGVESLFVEKSLYSNMHFNKIIKNKKELLNKLKKLNYKNRLKINIKKKSLIFLYIQDFIIKVNCSLLPIYLISRKIDQEKFWKEASQRLNKKNYLNDNFFKMLQKQINYKMRHTSNLETLRIKPSYLNDFND